MGRFVVGMDGSPPSVAAFDWVLRLARRFGSVVDLVTVAPEAPVADLLGVWDGGEGLDVALAAQDRVLGEVAHADVDLRSHVEQGQPSSVLLGMAKDADLLVIGTHGHGAVESALLGSISRQVATHAVCPTVLVPSDPGPVRRIVVGVDGSESALHALRWATELARRLDAVIEVVTAFHLAPMGVGSPWVPPVAAIGVDDLRRAAADLLATAVERADCADVVVERTVAEGPAATRLRDRAADADLLVVGSRGHGGFAGLLLGSVSRRCLAHPPVPVAIVPDH